MEEPGLDGLDLQSWERGSIETNIGGQEPITVGRGVSPNQEVGENAPSARVAMFSTALRVALEGSTCSPPHRFAEMPIDGDSRVLKKRGNEGFGAPRSGDQLSEHRRGQNEI